MKRKICVVTTSRAEFGLLRGLLKCIEADPALGLQVIVAGMHLSSEFGMTVREIEAEGVRISRRIKLRLTGNSDCSKRKVHRKGNIQLCRCVKGVAARYRRFVRRPV